MNIYIKLFEAKKEIGKITKDAKNPFFKSDYLSLNGLLTAVEAVLVNHGLVLIQPITDGHVTTMIIDTEAEADQEDHVKSSIQLPTISDPQKLGSAITYYRRYTLQSLLGLQAEDDDGNAATKQVQQDNRPELNSGQFESAKNFNVENLRKCISNYRMTKEQKKELQDILKQLTDGEN